MQSLSNPVPLEVRIEIAEHLFHWADFLAWRHADKFNLGIYSKKLDRRFSKFFVDAEVMQNMARCYTENHVCRAVWRSVFGVAIKVEIKVNRLPPTLPQWDEANEWTDKVRYRNFHASIFSLMNAKGTLSNVDPPGGTIFSTLERKQIATLSGLTTSGSVVCFIKDLLRFYDIRPSAPSRLVRGISSMCCFTCGRIVTPIRQPEPTQDPEEASNNLSLLSELPHFRDVHVLDYFAVGCYYYRPSEPVFNCRQRGLPDDLKEADFDLSLFNTGKISIAFLNCVDMGIEMALAIGVRARMRVCQSPLHRAPRKLVRLCHCACDRLTCNCGSEFTWIDAETSEPRVRVHPLNVWKLESLMDEVIRSLLVAFLYEVIGWRWDGENSSCMVRYLDRLSFWQDWFRQLAKTTENILELASQMRDMCQRIQRLKDIRDRKASRKMPM